MVRPAAPGWLSCWIWAWNIVWVGCVFSWDPSLDLGRAGEGWSEPPGAPGRGARQVGALGMGLALLWCSCSVLCRREQLSLCSPAGVPLEPSPGGSLLHDVYSCREGNGSSGNLPSVSHSLGWSCGPDRTAFPPGQENPDVFQGWLRDTPCSLSQGKRSFQDLWSLCGMSCCFPGLGLLGLESISCQDKGTWDCLFTWGGLWPLAELQHRQVGVYFLPQGLLARGKWQIFPPEVCVLSKSRSLLPVLWI